MISNAIVAFPLLLVIMKKTEVFKDIFTKHFHITTSGNFSDSALLCTMMEMGSDRIIYSVDWPYVENKPGTEWLETLAVSPEDKQKILNGNAKKLLKMAC